MKSISIIVPESSVIEAIADPQYIFNAVNNFLISSGKKQLFDIQLVGLTKNVRLENNLYTVHPEKLIDEVKKTDLILIPALRGDMENAIHLNKKFIPWIKKHYKNGAEIASLCVGSFLLASTGLLDGKKCSSHWNSSYQFRRMFPKVELLDDSIITEENGIYSSGGANSYWKLLLYFVEKFTNRETAILAAKYFAIDIDRESQSSFLIFEGQKNHEDKQILEAQIYIEDNYKDKFTISELADRIALGRRSFERRFKRATNNTVVEYTQRIKIEAAKRKFELSNKNISEVMIEVGYNDNKSFRTIFKKVTGLTPVEYKNKYRRNNSSDLSLRYSEYVV